MQVLAAGCEQVFAMTGKESLDFTIRIGSTPTFLYFDLYLYSAYAAHYVSYTSHTTKAGRSSGKHFELSRSVLL